MRETQKDGALAGELRRQTHADDLAASGADDERKLKEQRLNCLEECLSKLESRSREIITRYYVGKARVKIEQRRALGQRGQRLGVREGRVEEEADAQVRPPRAQQPRHEQQVVVVQPDAVAGAGLARDDVGEARVHGAVRVPVVRIGVGVVAPFVPGVSPPEPDPQHPDQRFGADSWAMWTGTSFAAPQISGALARLCYENPGLTPRAALDRLLTGRPVLPGHGRVVRLLPGTPTT